MSAKRRPPQAGDVFAVRLADGRWGALRVLKKLHDTSCVMVTEYIGDAPPALHDARLRRVQRYTWWEPGTTEGPKTPCVSWYDGALPSSLVHVGVLAPNARERRLGGRDAGYGYSGRWSAGMGWEVLHGWRHANDPAALRAEERRQAEPDRAAEKRERRRPPMKDVEFWKLVALIRPDESRSEDHRLAPLVAALARASTARIEAFHETLSRKLHRLDGRAFAKHIGSAAYRGDRASFSVDTFLYARAAAVARGAAFFRSVLRDPTRMPKDEELEGLLFVPERAFRRKTRRDDYEYIPDVDWETFANTKGWRRS